MTEVPSFAATLSRQAAQRRLAGIFAAAGLETAELDARVLLCAALGIDHAGLVREGDVSLGPAAATVGAFCAQRLAHQPVSRILGQREFWGLDFAISPAVLDPRPDTETLIECACDLLRDRRDAPLRFVDLGIGSGAILAALLSEFPRATGIGVDVSETAAVMAAKNLARLGFSERALVVRGNWAATLCGPVDLVVANPPYIAHHCLAELAVDVRLHDPQLALDGGEDGLAAYRALLPGVGRVLAPQGFVAVECGIGQADEVGALFAQAGLRSCGVRHDLAGVPRVVIAKLS